MAEKRSRPPLDKIMVNGQGNITNARDGSVEAHPEGVNDIGLEGDIKYVYEGKCYNPS